MARFATKADWAAAQASSLKAQIENIRSERIPSANWRKIRAKQAALENLRREQDRFEALANRFRNTGQ